MQLSWKDISTVPNSTDLLDIVLNRTQRKTPTVIRPGFSITRIRAFYMRKVKFTAEGFNEKFDDILSGFPKIDEVHPFHRDLMDTLYEKNHYKVSLAAISRAKTLIEQVARDYNRLLKFGQSLFQCKQLKRAALGRMATIAKKLKDPLTYLEQVRQHLGRLPSIDPNTRTIVICGYPNVGKSSFLRNVTKADVEVQPYAFTTKSLYVGHFDYKYLRFQAIDTPGILDRPVEDMNNIEMQSIYAIAHLRSTVMYFMDISEQCGFSIEAQVKLFNSIKPLFSNKSVMIVFNKSDIIKIEDLPEESQELIKSITSLDNVDIAEISCQNEENVMETRNRACEKLLSARIEQKLKGVAKSNNVLNKIHVANPQARDNVDRKPHIPEAVKYLKKFDLDDPNRKKLARDTEAENGGAGVYNINLKENYLLEDDSWKEDVMPEILNGRNVYDFLDPDIIQKLKALEEEEERLEQEGFYDSDSDIDDEEIEDIKEKATWIRNKQKEMINTARNRKALKNRGIMPRSKQVKNYKDMEEHMSNLGHDVSSLANRKRKLQGETYDADARGADVVRDESGSSYKKHKTPLRQADKRNAGVTDEVARAKAEKLAKVQRRERNRDARKGEGDRHQAVSLSKHLVAGKRGIGKTDYR